MKQEIPKLHECSHVLIVEGHSDLMFYAEFLRHLGRWRGVFIKQFEGKNKILSKDLLSDFLTPKLLAEKATIGILLDADDNPSGTASSVRDRLLEVTGRELSESQWHAKDGEARLGFFVAPDTSTQGEIETLAWNAFPDDDKHREMKSSVDQHLEKMTSLGWPPHSPDKARISAYLAAAYDEDARLGPGAREGKFAFDAPGFSRLRAFLEVLPQTF